MELLLPCCATIHSFLQAGAQWMGWTWASYVEVNRPVWSTLPWQGPKSNWVDKCMNKSLFKDNSLIDCEGHSNDIMRCACSPMPVDLSCCSIHLYPCISSLCSKNYAITFTLLNSCSTYAAAFTQHLSCSTYAATFTPKHLFCSAHAAEQNSFICKFHAAALMLPHLCHHTSTAAWTQHHSLSIHTAAFTQQHLCCRAHIAAFFGSFPVIHWCLEFKADKEDDSQCHAHSFQPTLLQGLNGEIHESAMELSLLEIHHDLLRLTHLFCVSLSHSHGILDGLFI